MSGTTSTHEFSGNTTCILYYKAFQGIWLKTILQWGMPSFCCWTRLGLLTKWLNCFDVHDVNWFSIQLSWNSIHTDTWLWVGFLSPVETWATVVVIVISWCALLLHSPCSCIFTFNPHQLLSIWYHPSHCLSREASVQSHRLYVCIHCIICISA